MLVDELIKQAYKSRDNISLNAYKNIKAELQQVLTAPNAPEYSNKLFEYTIAKYARKLEKTIHEVGENTNLGKEYQAELDVIVKLLPKPVTIESLINFIENDEEFFDKYWITLDDEDSSDYQNGGEGTIMKFQIPKKDMGKCIKYLKDKFPTADGKMISDVIKSYLIC